MHPNTAGIQAYGTFQRNYKNKNIQNISYEKSFRSDCCDSCHDRSERCSKKMNQFSADYFNCNPNPLEVVGTQVPATVTGNVPAKFFVKNATVTVTPVLVYGNYQTSGTPVKYQGEKVRGNDPVVSYDLGGSVVIPANFAYTPEMIKSELYLEFNVEQGKKQYVLPRVKVADGVIATAAFANAGTVDPAIAPDKFQRIINEKYSADIRFLINQANIRPGELKTAQMEAFNNDLKAAHADTSRVIKELNISSYASPDARSNSTPSWPSVAKTTPPHILKSSSRRT